MQPAGLVQVTAAIRAGLCVDDRGGCNPRDRFPLGARVGSEVQDFLKEQVRCKGIGG